MTKLGQVIQGIDPSIKTEEVVKEALNILMKSAEEKVNDFIEEIKTDLLDDKNTDKDSILNNIKK